MPISYNLDVIIWFDPLLIHMSLTLICLIPTIRIHPQYPTRRFLQDKGLLILSTAYVQSFMIIGEAVKTSKRNKQTHFPVCNFSKDNIICHINIDTILL